MKFFKKYIHKKINNTICEDFFHHKSIENYDYTFAQRLLNVCIKNWGKIHYKVNRQNLILVTRQQCAYFIEKIKNDYT